MHVGTAVVLSIGFKDGFNVVGNDDGITIVGTDDAITLALYDGINVLVNDDGATVKGSEGTELGVIVGNIVAGLDGSHVGVSEEVTVGIEGTFGVKDGSFVGSNDATTNNNKQQQTAANYNNKQVETAANSSKQHQSS